MKDSPHTMRLDTKVKRLGAVVLVVGVAITWISLYQIASSIFNYRDTLDYWWDAITSFGRSGRGYIAAPIGLWVMVIGLMLSFLYDFTIRLVVEWVKAGR